ncbi:MAG: PorT family protein, partial [Bacteroidetes bacterium]|nr:PorT family protein [Bacteroidota bacterium]MCL2303600.1 PorT family protein [Lentimicrobiaceae bacterium]
TGAQESQKKHFSPEFKLSFNFPNKTLLGGYGFGAGVHNAFFNQKRWNLIIGLEYNVVFRNMVFLLDDVGGHYHYIGIPINVRVNFGKKVKFFIEAGAFFDPLVLEKRKPIEKDISTTEKTIYVYNPDFGISGGVGLRIPVKKYEILIKSDYKSGMRHLFDYSFITRFNSYWRFAVGFKM